MSVLTQGIEISDPTSYGLVEVRLSGKLEKQDYEMFVPELERVIEEYGKLKMIVILDHFHGWTVGGLWEDIKFDVRHFNDLERLAIVGDTKWEKGMAAFCKPFTSAKVQFFASERLNEARWWVVGDS